MCEGNYKTQYRYLLKDRDSKDVYCISHGIFAIYDYDKRLDIVCVRDANIPCCVCEMVNDS